MEKPKNYQHALIIGGTGMLKAASLAIIDKYEKTTLIARNVDRLEQIAINPKTNPISLNYTDSNMLKAALKSSTQKYGSFDLAIIWIHSTAPQAPYIAAEFVNADYYHLLGSSYGKPGEDNTERLAKFRDFKNLNYHEIILGFILEDNASRWLSHNEISTGVLKAIKQQQKSFVVGTLSPWSARP